MAEGKETCAAHTDKRGLWPRAQRGVLDSIYLCILTLLPWWQNTCMVTFFNDWGFFYLHSSPPFRKTNSYRCDKANTFPLGRECGKEMVPGAVPESWGQKGAGLEHICCFRLPGHSP